MKGQMVGNTSTALLWPNAAAMSELKLISRPYNSLVSSTAASTDLLWPARLINEQARLRKCKNPARIIATIAFILSIILTVIAGPIQLVLIATMLDYNWTTTVYYPTALQYLLPASSFAAALTAVAVILSWRTHPRFTRTVAILSLGTLIEIGLLWLFGCVVAVQPHVLSLIFIVTTLGFFAASLFVSKQYVAQSENGQLIQFFLGFLLVLSAFEILLGPLCIVESAFSQTNSDFDRIAAEQAAARIDGVPELLSNMTFVLCNGKYQVIYLSDTSESGIFECDNNHEVYSIENLGEQNLNSVHGAATYLGTTQDPAITLAFPTSYYLYRQLPSLTEDELALMVPAHSERELVDDFTDPLLQYWQAHHDRNLFVNIFYNTNISSVAHSLPSSDNAIPFSSTRNYVLMAAMGIMAMTDQLPSGTNTYRSPLGNEMMNYVFKTDRNLTALNELGARPELYAPNTRDALKTHRHVSLHLNAIDDANIDYANLRTRLEQAFVTGNE